MTGDTVARALRACCGCSGTDTRFNSNLWIVLLSARIVRAQDLLCPQRLLRLLVIPT